MGTNISFIPRKVTTYVYLLDYLDVSYCTPEAGKEYVCLFLNDTTGDWSRAGVTTLGFDKKTNITKCSSNHLTSFTVLQVSQPLDVTPADIKKIIGSVLATFYCVSPSSLSSSR